MNKTIPFGLGRLVNLTVLLVGLFVGCSKKQEAAVSGPKAVDQSPTQAGAVQPTAQPSAAVVSAVAEVQQAVKNKDYDRALDALLAPPRAVNPSTPEDAAKINAAMGQLQAQLAAAAAAGDAKAIAAREKLRQHFLRMP